jgi:hypothetical protein
MTAFGRKRHWVYGFTCSENKPGALEAINPTDTEFIASPRYSEKDNIKTIWQRENGGRGIYIPTALVFNLRLKMRALILVNGRDNMGVWQK